VYINIKAINTGNAESIFKVKQKNVLWGEQVKHETALKHRTGMHSWQLMMYYMKTALSGIALQIHSFVLKLMQCSQNITKEMEELKPHTHTRIHYNDEGTVPRSSSIQDVSSYALTLRLELPSRKTVQRTLRH
jgi:hypothetical protein